MDKTHLVAPSIVQVLVEDQTERRLGYDVDLTDVIYSLKRAIEETEGISTFQQRLGFGTNDLELDDHRTFQSCGITGSSILYLSIDHIAPVFEVQAGLDEGKAPRERVKFTGLLTNLFLTIADTTRHKILNDLGGMKHSKTKIDDISIPALSPPPLQCFTVPLGERGFSCVKVEVRLRPLQVPGGRIPIDVVLKCISAHPRRISSVMLSLVFPENDIEDLHPPNELGSETTTITETTDNREVGLNAGIAFQGMSAGGGYTRGFGTMKSAARVTRMKIEGRVTDVNTASWSLTEDVGQEDGLPHQVSMRFTLGSEPAEVNMLECRITSVKNGRLTTKYGSQKYLGRGTASPFVEDEN